MSNPRRKYDVAVVGGGIVGLSIAWAAAKSGASTIVFERSARAEGASIRNFGLIWTIGQPQGKRFELSLRSRDLWLELAEESGLWINPCGSLHLLRNADELAVIEEFLQLDPRGNELSLLTPAETASRSPGVNTDGLLAALWSPWDMGINPVSALKCFSTYLSGKHNVEFEFGSTVTRIDDDALWTANAVEFSASKIFVCGGSDFETLFPDQFRNAKLRKCKLQMMATDKQPNHWKLGPTLASGLSLRHYLPFDVCPSLDLLKQRISEEHPELERFGIHILASQNDHGEILIGDSHQYDDDITPFRSQQIDDLILRELNKLVQFPDSKISRRWTGVYPKFDDDFYFLANLDSITTIVTGLGGSGMTLSPALAEQLIREELA